MNYTQSLNSALSGLMQSYYGGKAGAQSGEDAAYKRMQVESEIGRNSAAAQVDQGKLARMLEQRQFYQDPERSQQMAADLNSDNLVTRTRALLGNLYGLPDNATAENVMGGQVKLWDRGDTERAMTDPQFRLGLNGAKAADSGKLFDPIGETGYVMNQGSGTIDVVSEPLAKLAQAKINSEISRNNRLPAPPRNPSSPAARNVKYFDSPLSGGAFLATLDPQDRAHVLAIVEGREPYPTSKLILQPYYQRLLEAVAKYDPNFDATRYKTRQRAANDFTTGTQGKQLLAFGSAMGHLETLDSLVDAMDGRDMLAVNRIANAFSKQTGSPAVTNFDAAKAVVAKEVMKAIVAGGGGVEERQELSRLMENAKSPQQLRGVISTYIELMRVQHDNLVTQYKAAGLDPSRLPDYSVGHGGDSSHKQSGDRQSLMSQNVQWLKNKNPQNQQQFNAAVRELKAKGWSDTEIQQIQHEAGY